MSNRAESNLPCRSFNICIELIRLDRFLSLILRYTMEFCSEDQSECIGCGDPTKYRCLKCSAFVCNKSLERSIFVDESYPGRKQAESVALCRTCDGQEMYSIDDNDDQDDAELEENNGTAESMENKEHFEIKCGSRGFHQYRKFWTPRLSEKLEVVRERGNVYDPYAMALRIKTRKTIDGHRVIGHRSFFTTIEGKWRLLYQA